jgi:Fe-S oxidoreductase
MLDEIQSPAQASYWGIDGHLLFGSITLVAFSLFAYILWRRFAFLLRNAPDPRFTNLHLRIRTLLKYWLAQWKQPRYRFAGILHIIIFAGFLALAANSLSMLLIGLGISDRLLADASRLLDLYRVVTDYAATAVFIAVLVAAIRRGIFTPKRYAVPVPYGRGHGAEALTVLALIAALMLSASLFEATSRFLRIAGPVPSPSVFCLSWFWYKSLAAVSPLAIRKLYLGSYLCHQVTFCTFLCLLPLGKHFHVVTSVFNVFFAKGDREALKPARWDLTEEQLADAQSLGAKNFQDFTWKQVLDFYSCADCGRCSDQCPSASSGRPLSPRFFTIKARDYIFRHYPVFGTSKNGTALIGGVYSEDEIWSCTTCGACEEECPLLIEYIDKIVDVRRGLVDDSKVPTSLQKPLKAIESRGNPYGKLEKKRADWARSEEFQKTCKVPVANGDRIQTLYFVDSITSYDDRMQRIAKATARLLNHIGEDFAILGTAEKDSGHEVRRFGEEMLFFALRDHNTEAIRKCGAQRIVTSDPHALNALKHDYQNLPPVQHISQRIAAALASGRIQFHRVENPTETYTFHDPCYLGRHNHLYDAPRDVLDAIPGLNRVEMRRCRDRSFCCGGGGLMLFYEPKEDERMGVMRVRMAAETGANVIVTACPFCLANIEDAIKVAGLEETMTAIDLVELADRQMVPKMVSPGV